MMFIGSRRYLLLTIRLEKTTNTHLGRSTLLTSSVVLSTSLTMAIGQITIIQVATYLLIVVLAQMVARSAIAIGVKSAQV